jgi:hypothetical protein
MKTTGALNKEAKDSKMTKSHPQYSTSKRKKRHRKVKEGITAPYGNAGTIEDYYTY